MNSRNVSSAKHGQQGKVVIGVVLMVLAVGAAALVYSMRPPEGIADAVRMAARGQDFIEEPYYQVALAVSSVLAVVGAILFLTATIGLDRSQATIEDNMFMSSMIPHHSMAIIRSERANLDDLRVCELAVEISEAQRREIFEMEWLIADIERNGVARTPEEAAARQVPEFEEPAERQCGAS
jgi:hypothetical protein